MPTFIKSQKRKLERCKVSKAVKDRVWKFLWDNKSDSCAKFNKKETSVLLTLIDLKSSFDTTAEYFGDGKYVITTKKRKYF